MTKRNPVSSQQNIFFDSAQLDENNLILEQNYNNNFQTSLINNHIGNGVLPDELNQAVLFDSMLVSGLLDGIAINSQTQPTDNNYGNQLEVALTGSAVAGKKTVKIAIIGLDFQGNLQFDTLTFKVNEKQVTKRHYTSILLILLNDFVGPVAQSFNLGGRIVIREAAPIFLSRDPIMVSQDIEPSLFWRDFFVVGFTTLQSLLTASLPLYNIDNLNIKTGPLYNNIIAANDVTTQIGEKFQATTNNIEKVTLLLSVQNSAIGQSTNLNWTGDLIVSIYALQSTINCITDIVPNLPIDYDPSNIPLAQVSFDLATLQSNGILLDGNPQPVDFVFSNTPVASGNSITVGQYYAVTVKRAGSADTCDILLATGGSYSATSRLTTFSGNGWIDNADQELWFKVYTDAAKVTDGQAYETGHGVIVPKTELNTTTNTTIDYSLDGIQFTGSELFTAVLEATTQQSEPVQDQRTGNDINSEQQFVPTIQLLNPIDFGNLTAASEPFTIAAIEDGNQKVFIPSASTLTAALHGWDFIDNQFVIKIIDDVTDGYRYDPNVNALVSNLLNGDLINAKIVPNVGNPNSFYRIAKAEIVSMIYGDVDNDGVITENDLTVLNELINAAPYFTFPQINSSPPSSTQITTGGGFTTVNNGYPVYANPFVTDDVITFQIVNPSNNAIIASNTDGYLLVNPNNPSLATFGSATNFSTISGIGTYNLVIQMSSSAANIGVFPISGVNISSNFVINISKLYYTSDTMLQLLRADINGDGYVNNTDGYLLQQYIFKAPPFPPASLPSTRIGTRFNALRITVDPFVDRSDDFPATQSNRSTVLHAEQDIFSNDGYLQNHDFKDFPVTFNIIKQFTWEDCLITTIANPRPAVSVYSATTSSPINACEPIGNIYQTYPVLSNFDPGQINFFVPNDVIIGTGDLKRPDGNFYKVDYEFGSITLEIPNTVLGTEQTINVFDYFVVDYNGAGITRLGYPAMMFSDCSTVKSTAIINNQIRFSVASQSFSPNINGVDIDGYTGIVVDGRIGVYIDNSTGLLRLNFANLYQDPVLQTLSTKVQVNVFLKKAGFNNAPLFIDSNQMANLLTLI